MTKFFLLVARDSSCAFLEFADYLETSLLRDVARAAPYAVLARINKMIPGATVTAAHIHDVPPTPPFHAAIEGWLPETADIIRLHRDIDDAFEPGSAIDSNQTRLLAIESHATPGRDLPASIGAPDDGTMLKMLIKLQRRPGITRAFFRDYYEGNHAPLAAKYLPMIAGYQRNYVLQELPAFPFVGDDGPRPIEEADAIVEFWFRDEAAFKSMSAAFTDPVIGRMFAQDEDRLFDRSNIQMNLVDERVILAARPA